MSSSIAQGSQPPVSSLDRQLATHIHMRSEISENVLRRDWYNAILHNVQAWRERRVFRPSETPSRACWEFANATGGDYYEGLVWLPEHRVPQPAVWCHDASRLTCFSHDLTGDHAIQGIPFDLSAIRGFLDDGMLGPFLFHADRRVYEFGISWIEMPTIRDGSVH